jgi:PmbA protein
MEQKFVKIGQDLVAKAKKNGADSAEVYIIQSQDLSIEVSNGQIETLKNAETRGLGLRVIKDEGMGYSFSADFSQTALNDIVNQSIANAKIVEKDPYNKILNHGYEYAKLDLYDKEIITTPLENKIDIAKEIEIAARNEDKRITITENCSYQDSSYSICLVNSEGLTVSYQGAYCGAYAFLVGEENGDSQTGFAVQYGLKFSFLDPKKIGKEAAQKAVRMLGAKEIPTQKAIVVLDPYVVTNFLGILAPSLLAESVQKGRSIFANKIGETVADSKITIIDDGLLDGGINSAPFDGEGVASQRTILIEKGKLKGFLHNSYTAAKDNVQSTGNAIRGTFKSTPEVGTTNFYIDKGTLKREQLIKEVGKGLYITDVMGIHTANPISGDFSVGAAGIWIENGEFKSPVRGVAIAGNLGNLLKSIDGVGDDLTFFVGKGAPTIRISEMTISGS